MIRGVVDYRHLTPDEASSRIGQFKAVYAAVFCLPPYNETPEAADAFAAGVADELTQPGFDFVAAVEYGVVVGFVYGHQQAAGAWLPDADGPAPDEVLSGPTFAVRKWAVLPDRRGAGVGRRLMDELLDGRDEGYAVTVVHPEAGARDLYQQWGWSSVASTGAGMDVIVRKLG
jgi:predicted N-acetyltransferase YhbS